MAWSEQDRDALKRAIASGVKSVAYTDRRVEYRSLEEMKDTLGLIEDELAQRKRVGRVYMRLSNGVRS